jgi:signal peptidase II
LADAVQDKPAGSYVWGRLSALGLAVAAITCAIDQASKFWLLFDFDLVNRSPFSLTPFIDLSLTFNTGISYGLFPQQGPVGPWALLAFKVVAVIFLWVWLTRATSRLTALALGLIIGGAVGNAIDRLHWPGVMDFVLFHTSCCSTSTQPPLPSAGMFSTWPMSPLLRAFSDCYMNRLCAGTP